MMANSSEIVVRKMKIAHREKLLVSYEEKLRQFSDTTRLKSAELGMVKEMSKSSRLANVRHRTHNLTTQMDSVLRPPDQSNDIRTYSKMDSDIWKYEDVRFWFNKNASEDPNAGAYIPNSADLAYVVKV
jgi:hypothetical protein